MSMGSTMIQQAELRRDDAAKGRPSSVSKRQLVVTGAAMMIPGSQALPATAILYYPKGSDQPKLLDLGKGIQRLQDHILSNIQDPIEKKKAMDAFYTKSKPVPDPSQEVMVFPKRSEGFWPRLWYKCCGGPQPYLVKRESIGAIV